MPIMIVSTTGTLLTASITIAEMLLLGRPPSLYQMQKTGRVLVPIRRERKARRASYLDFSHTTTSRMT